MTTCILKKDTVWQVCSKLESNYTFSGVGGGGLTHWVEERGRESHGCKYFKLTSHETFHGPEKFMFLKHLVQWYKRFPDSIRIKFRWTLYFESILSESHPITSYPD
jgi:hypothetical protein